MDATAHLQQELRFGITSGSGHSVTVDMLDTYMQGETSMGFSPMELLLVALAGCTGISVLTVLRKRRQEVTGYELQVHGKRAKEHPRVFTDITVHHIFIGNALEEKWIARAITLSEQQFCGVEAMLNKTASITHTYTIKNGLDEKL
jgi:putative redox protein